jgi:hypothetical protein
MNAQVLYAWMVMIISSYLEIAVERGDRSSDGQLNTDFVFGVSEEPSLIIDGGVRVSHRLLKKSRLKAEEESVQCLEVVEDETTIVQTNSTTPISVLPAEGEDETTQVETNRTTPIRRCTLSWQGKTMRSTFAYQQLMFDVSREILHYTSRWMYIMLTLVILFTNSY